MHKPSLFARKPSTERQRLALEYGAILRQLKGVQAHLKSLRCRGALTAGQELRCLKELQEAETAWKRQYELRKAALSKPPGITPA